MDVLVAGGGIARLTTALTCHQIGVPVRVYEAMPELRPLGLGINLQPNAVRELYELGLDAELATIGVETRELALVARDGSDVWAEPRGLDAGYRWPQLSVHRGELEMVLYRAVVERLGPEAVVTGHRVAGYEHTKGGVRAEIVTGEGATTVVDGTVLLAADGLHSAIRSQMFPGEGGPRWGGAVLWRGTAPGPPIRRGGSFVVVGNQGQRFVTFPITEPDPTTGEQIHNWIAELRFDPSRGWRRGDWNTRVESDEFVGEFDVWDFGWLDVPAMIGRSEVIYEYPMVDRDPVDHWVHGSVALLGDAAHAMYPVGSNGASHAIVDARVLGAAFARHGVGRDALDAYQATRLEPLSAMLLANRGAGPVSVLGTVDDRSRRVFGDADAVSESELEEFIAGYRTASATEIDAFNRTPPTIAESMICESTGAEG